MSPADGTVLHFGEVENGRVECVKGHDYDLEDFLGPIDFKVKVGSRFRGVNDNIRHLARQQTLPAGGVPGTRRLSRLSFPCEMGKLQHCSPPRLCSPRGARAYWMFSGFLLSVRPSVLKWIPNLLCINERVVLTGSWKHGFFSMSAVAATNVGDIVIDSVRLHGDKLYLNRH